MLASATDLMETLARSRSSAWSPLEGVETWSEMHNPIPTQYHGTRITGHLTSYLVGVATEPKPSACITASWRAGRTSAIL
jgi:hypothetical protein